MFAYVEKTRNDSRMGQRSGPERAIEKIAREFPSL